MLTKRHGINSVAQELLFRMLPDGVAGSDEELIEQLELLEGMSLVGRCIVSNAGVGGGCSDDGECVSGVESLWAFKNVLHQQVCATACVVPHMRVFWLSVGGGAFLNMRPLTRL
jgi:hypothetical protein